MFYLYHIRMALTPIGRIAVATPGTFVQVTAVHARAQTVFFQTAKNKDHTNSGQMYVYYGPTAATAARVGTLGVPSAGNVPAFSATIAGSSGSLPLNSFWIDADNATDEVDACYMGP
jgi:hypothetical protein